MGGGGGGGGGGVTTTSRRTRRRSLEFCLYLSSNGSYVFCVLAALRTLNVSSRYLA